MCCHCKAESGFLIQSGELTPDGTCFDTCFVTAKYTCLLLLLLRQPDRAYSSPEATLTCSVCLEGMQPRRHAERKPQAFPIATAIRDQQNRQHAMRGLQE